MDPIIKTEKLCFSYDGASFAISDISLEIYRGEAVSIIGPNGSGKTTLVKHFNGLLKPTSGRVFVNGMDTRKTTTAELARTIGYVFQNPNHQIFSNTVLDEVVFGPKNVGFKDAEKLAIASLESVNLGDKVDASPFSLSLGEKERLAIASLLAMQPDILILDEPTTGQDYSTCLAIMNLASNLKRLGKTMILITHDMDVAAEWTDRVFVLSEGFLLRQGKPSEVFSDFDFLQSIHLSPPQMLKVGRLLGFESVYMSVDELAGRLKSEISQLYKSGIVFS